MSSSSNGKTIALVVIIVVLALLAIRSIFFILPFGLFSSMSIGNGGHAFGHFFRGFNGLGPGLLFLLLPVLILLLWGAVLVWVYRDAESRGMSGILWLLLVLIGNIVGLLIYAIVRSETPVRRPDQQRPAGPEAGPVGGNVPGKCPGCGSPIGKDFAFCPQCGKGLRMTCPSCGKAVDGSWKVCPACGATIDPTAPLKV